MRNLSIDHEHVWGMRRPYFKKQKKAWYVYHGGKQRRLATDKDEAFKEWNRLTSSVPKIGDLITSYLEWVKSNRSKRTHQSSKAPKPTSMTSPGGVATWVWMS